MRTHLSIQFLIASSKNRAVMRDICSCCLVNLHRWYLSVALEKDPLRFPRGSAAVLSVKLRAFL